jgi:hypothetical protein
MRVTYDRNISVPPLHLNTGGIWRLLRKLRLRYKSPRNHIQKKVLTLTTFYINLILQSLHLSSFFSAVDGCHHLFSVFVHEKSSTRICTNSFSMSNFAHSIEPDPIRYSFLTFQTEPLLIPCKVIPHTHFPTIRAILFGQNCWKFTLIPL